MLHVGGMTLTNRVARWGFFARTASEICFLVNGCPREVLALSLVHLDAESGVSVATRPLGPYHGPRGGGGRPLTSEVPL